ncbi:MAG: hypothetical protein ACR2NZ_07940 [Rubripirellula sp.]
MMISLIRNRRYAATAIAVVVVSLVVPRQPRAEEVASREQTATLPLKLADSTSIEQNEIVSLVPTSASTIPDGVCRLSEDRVDFAEDRFWLINTRSMSSSACRIDLESPGYSVFQLECNGRCARTTLDQYLASLGPERSAVIYVHGNRMQSQEAIGRGLAVYRSISRYRDARPVDWLIWSWPSSKQGMLIHDARRKASRTDAQGLYLAWLLQKHVDMDVPTTLIGFSFGGRVITGALHALAGGTLGGRQLSGPPTTGIPFEAGLVAPAIDSHWLAERGYHSNATKNLDRLVLLYNRRDAVLKRYWLLDRVRGRMALGYSGPRVFASRADGTKLPVFSRDCSPSIGLQHDELDYYRKSCHAGSIMAKLIDDIDISH